MCTVGSICIIFEFTNKTFLYQHKTVTIGVVYRCPNITKQNSEKIHNGISEVSKGDCIIMGDFNHGNIKWDTLQSTGVEDQKLLCLVQDNFLTQHVLEPTRATRVLDIVLSSQKEFVDNVVTQEPLGSSRWLQLIDCQTTFVYLIQPVN